MRISLANVQFHEGNNMFPPLGLLYVAAALRADGHRVQVLDGDPLLETDMAARMVGFGPDLVGLSCLTMTAQRAARLAAELRARLPGVPMMAGGAHATAAPEDTLRRLGVDVVVIGEGEETARACAGCFASGEDPTGLPGTLTAGGRGPARPPLVDLDRLPLPARDLCDFERYLSPPGLIRGLAGARHASILAGRGCRYRCTFCASHLQLGRTLRMRSVERVLAEIDHLVARHAIAGLYFVDDIFTGDRPWVRRFCSALADRGYGLEWGCQSRVESVDRWTLGLMAAAGCVQVDFGVESGSKQVLRRMKKGTTFDSVVAAFDLVHSMGMRTGASFILGSPGETEEDLRQTLELARRIRSEWTVFFFSTPYPGTELWHQLLDQGRLDALPDFGDAWNNRQARTPFSIGELSPDRLARWRRVAQNRHFRSNYLRWRNLPYALRLAGVAVSRPSLIGQAVQVAVRGGRLDDVVESVFAADRARISLRRRGPTVKAPTAPTTVAAVGPKPAAVALPAG